MTLQRVQRGDALEFPAEAFNTIIDLKDASDRAKMNRGGPGTSPRRTRGVEVRVRNDSGTDRARFHVLGIDGPLFLPTVNLDSFQNEIILKGIRPVVDDPFTGHLDGRFVILLEPIASGGIGRALLSGCCPVKLDVTAETDTRADVIHNDPSMLRTAVDGAARVLWKEAGTGTNLWGLVEFPADAPFPTIIEGTLDGALAAGGTQTINSAEYTVTAPYVLASGSIASGKRVEAMLDANGDYIVRWAEC